MIILAIALLLDYQSMNMGIPLKVSLIMAAMPVAFNSVIAANIKIKSRFGQFLLDFYYIRSLICIAIATLCYQLILIMCKKSVCDYLEKAFFESNVTLDF